MKKKRIIGSGKSKLIKTDKMTGGEAKYSIG